MYSTDDREPADIVRRILGDAGLATMRERMARHRAGRRKRQQALDADPTAGLVAVLVARIARLEREVVEVRADAAAALRRAATLEGRG